ncbi:MAG: hypothetical protein A3D31_12725 [Candidatus Fluviicola riflensis]|nr:MAG: hypothetical protein A3D31_12725 [Candidatus Fluviicola riflensis]OGS84913.1 MAG: hypothetical protein A2724_09660 [Fluviicola sp. RIFCSPHIGHO2_01_FULL_43_53]OGS89185.1 MAG: hypothetical protein A3E30_03965 [Fluviicola sp. RIFCSPHIGHO2_12_FULL_43_24]
MVGLTMRENVDLVSKDYYQLELEYQEKINKMERTSALKEPMTWQILGDTLLLKFPRVNKGEYAAKVFFFRPSNAHLDRMITLPSDSDSLRYISLAQLKKGMYRMQIDWLSGRDSYYNEGVIQIP